MQSSHLTSGSKILAISRIWQQGWAHNSFCQTKVTPVVDRSVWLNFIWIESTYYVKVLNQFNFWLKVFSLELYHLNSQLKCLCKELTQFSLWLKPKKLIILNWHMIYHWVLCLLKFFWHYLHFNALFKAKSIYMTAYFIVWMFYSINNSNSFSRKWIHLTHDSGAFTEIDLT